MMEFYVTGQKVRYASPVIAANSRDFLQARFHFSGDVWDGYSKWAHFRQGETVYDLNLVEDEIKSDMHLNLSIGSWEMYLTGNRGESRLTTVPVIIQVMESGLIDEPLHQIPMTVAEQVDSKASLALEKTEEICRAIESGELDGSDFKILGYFPSLEKLLQEVPMPERGDVYGVGEAAPYDIYIYDGINGRWVNNGSIQGPAGERGEKGVTFIPSVDSYGNLSWANDGGLDNPDTANIRGAKGEQGERGEKGSSPYELAVKEGFSGTEATFNWSLAHIASHAGQHGSGGTDPVVLDGDGIRDGAVSRNKLAADAKALVFTGISVKTDDWSEDGTYTDFSFRASIPCSGVTENFVPSVVFHPEEAVSSLFAPVALSFDGGVYIYANGRPEKELSIPCILCVPVA